jgi:tetratricopeptide (TPR) repeat protein
MTANIHTTTIVVVLLFLAGLFIHPSAIAQHGHMHDDSALDADAQIGTVDFQVSCNAGVSEKFDRALGMLHHMMYEQARSEFEAIIETDPECAMAYWGVATTLFQPLWPARPGEEARQRGWRLIQKAAALEPGTERERRLVEAAAEFFREPETATYWDRIGRWAEAMAVAYQASPDDHDTAALYALSRLSLALGGEELNPLHDEAEAVLRSIWEKEPAHPGAIHYSIHATDVDGRAANALDMVEVYGEIAPQVPHALHMPSHIYVRLGDWPEVIDWNRRSADAALERPVNGAISLHYIHAMDYLLYAYLQKGEDDAARSVFEETMLHKDKHQPSYVSAFHLAAMPARKAVEQRDWKAATELEPRTPANQPWDDALWPEGMTWYALGLGGVHTGRLEKALEAEQRLKALRDRAKADGEDRFATYIEVDRLILSGWIAKAEGDVQEAVRLLNTAAALEGTVEKDPTTPGALLPPYEALGDLYISLGRPVEALEAYQAADQIWPGRYNTLLGAARAAVQAGDDATARKKYSRLLELAGDSQRPGVREARHFMDG